MNLRLVAFALAALLIATACGPAADPKRGMVVARVHNKYLYEADIQGVVPAGTSRKDSVVLVQNYIDSWVRKQLLIRQAERNLSPKEQDFSKQLEEYRNSLLIFAYESALINQKLDTVVTDREIEEYYNLNKRSFELKYNIVKVVYVVLPVDSEEITRFRKLLSDRDTILSAQVELLARQHAYSYFVGDETWVRFDDLLAQLPIETYNQELFLRNNRFIEIKDDPFIYLIRFKDFLITESIPPLEVEYDNIRNIILNKRRQDLIRSMHQQIYDQALRDRAFEVY
ncbi:MAG: hypothetical protein IPM52_00125 [Bacteroidetes bacterium]|nr:hypothetical protein [Bacteroidota bacterium]